MLHKPEKKNFAKERSTFSKPDWGHYQRLTLKSRSFSNNLWSSCLCSVGRPHPRSCLSAGRDQDCNNFVQVKVVRSTFAIALFSYSVLDKVGTVKDFQRYVSSQKIQKIRADKEPMILKNDYSVSFLFTPQFSKEGKAHHIVLFRFRTEQREGQLKKSPGC